MKHLLILILAFSTAVLSYLLIEEKNNTSSEEESKPYQIDYYANFNTPYQIDYFLKNDSVEDSVLYINGRFYDRIEEGLVLDNPPTGVYELGNINEYLPKKKILEITKQNKIKRINFNNYSK